MLFHIKLPAVTLEQRTIQDSGKRQTVGQIRKDHLLNSYFCLTSAVQHGF